MSGSPSACGSSTEPPTGDLLSKFVNTLVNFDIIASNNIGEVSLVGLEIREGGIRRRPAYRTVRERRGHHTNRETKELLSRASNQRTGNCLPNLETAITQPIF